MIDEAEIHRMANSADVEERRKVAGLLKYIHKWGAWEDLHRLTQDEDSDVRGKAARALGSAFCDVADKDTAWSDLHRLTQDEVSDVRRKAAWALGSCFSVVPDKDTAWSDLIKLTLDKEIVVRWYAARALGSVFCEVADKDAAWVDLHRLTQDGDSDVRKNAAWALGSAFCDVANKDTAWSDLHRLTQDEDSDVRKNAAWALGSCFSVVPDKDTAWSDLIRLTQDENSDVRMYVYHSLGSASVYKATTGEEDKFRDELKKAIDYFEQSSNEAENKYYNPAQFCLPFYRSYCAVISEKQEAEAEATKYLDEAKKATDWSKSKEALLEAVEYLANALKVAQKPLEFGETKEHLRACRQYCDHAAELADSTRGKSPVAAAAIMRGIPIVGVKVKEIIAEIQAKAEALCKQTKGTPYEELGKEVNQIGRKILKVRSRETLEKCVRNLLIPLSAIYEQMPDGDKEDAAKMLEIIENEEYVEDILNLSNMYLSKVSSQINKEKNMPKIEITDVNDSIIQINDGEKGSQKAVLSKNTEKKRNQKKSLEDVINTPITIGGYIGLLTVEIMAYATQRTYYHLIIIAVTLLASITVLIYMGIKKE